MYTLGPVNAAQAGCDIYYLRQSIIEQLPFPSTSSPLKQLKVGGLKLDAQFSADLNSDDQADWLVWTDNLPHQALIFISSGKRYQILQEHVFAPNEQARFSTMPLPNGAGTALVRLAFGNQKLLIPKPSFHVGKINRPVQSVWRGLPKAVGKLLVGIYSVRRAH